MSSNISQNFEDSRKLRQEYRELTEDVKNTKNELLKPDNEELTTKVKQANLLFDKVTGVREGALDARFMAISVQLGVQKAAQMQTDLISFKPLDFMEKLVARMGGSYADEQENLVEMPEEGWNSLIKKPSDYFNIIPSLSPMLGVCSYSPKKIIRKSNDKTKDKQGEKCQPTNITNFKNNGKETTPEEIERVLGIIQSIYRQHQEPIDYFELVVHPSSFGHTIENIFHLSFLVKDGFVEMSLNEDGLPVIVPVENTQTSKLPKSDADDSSTTQVMISLSMTEWEEVVKAYELTGKRPWIKARNR